MSTMGSPDGQGLRTSAWLRQGPQSSDCILSARGGRELAQDWGSRDSSGREAVSIRAGPELRWSELGRPGFDRPAMRSTHEGVGPLFWGAEWGGPRGGGVRARPAIY